MLEFVSRFSKLVGDSRLTQCLQGKVGQGRRAHLPIPNAPNGSRRSHNCNNYDDGENSVFKSRSGGVIILTP